MKNKILSFTLAFAMVLSLITALPITVSAETDGYYTYTVTDGKATITDFSESGNVVIPDTLGGYPVTSIGDSAFHSCNLTWITIPDSITSIGDRAFYNCCYLTSVTIPNSVTSIGNSAFSSCVGLTSVTIGSGVTSIGNYAFNFCYNLTSIKIPDSVTSIGGGAFYQCYNLCSVYYDGTKDEFNKISISSYNDDLLNANIVYLGEPQVSGYYTYTVTDGEATITDVDTSISGNVVIPDTLGGYPVTSIDDYAFSYCSSLTSITIPDSVTSIGDSAFSCCHGLTNVTIGSGVTGIGYDAFYYCDSLTSVTIGSGVTSIGVYAFSKCYSLTSITVDENNPNYCSFEGNVFDKNKTTLIQYAVGKKNTSYTIPEGVISIGQRAFYDCYRLTSITIPDSVTSIGYGAFYICDGLTSITIPDSVTSIGDCAFYSCESLTSVTIGSGLTSISNYAFCDCESLTSITIPDSVTSIGRSAFSGCSSLTSVTIGSGLTSISNWVFSNCESLTSITVDENNPNYCSFEGNVFDKNKTTLIQYAVGKKNTSYTIPEGVTSIGNNAFYYCDSLTSVTIGSGVTSIGDEAFLGCSSLTNITIPDSVTSIGNWAFGRCSSLTSIIIPNGVTNIGEKAFISCSSLTSITIPDSVTSIGYGVFLFCDNLTSITIPDSVTSIEDSAFYGCDSLTDVYYEGTEEDWNKIVIDMKNDYLTNATIHYKEVFSEVIEGSISYEKETKQVVIYTDETVPSCKLMVAAYCGNKMTELKSIDTKLMSGKNVFVNLVKNFDNADTLKIFVWSGLSFTPMLENCTVELN